MLNKDKWLTISLNLERDSYQHCRVRAAIAGRAGGAAGYIRELIAADMHEADTHTIDAQVGGKAK